MDVGFKFHLIFLCKNITQPSRSEFTKRLHTPNESNISYVQLRIVQVLCPTKIHLTVHSVHKSEPPYKLEDYPSTF